MMFFVYTVLARHAYLATMKKFEWHKVASLTQDGSKYSHYMSSLQDVLQENGIDFVINRKYQRDTVDMSLVRLTFRLYNFIMDTCKETFNIIFVHFPP